MESLDDVLPGRSWTSSGFDIVFSRVVEVTAEFSVTAVAGGFVVVDIFSTSQVESECIESRE